MATPEQLAEMYTNKPKAGAENRALRRMATPVAPDHGDPKSWRNAGVNGGPKAKYPARA